MSLVSKSRMLLMVASVINRLIIKYVLIFCVKACIVVAPMAVACKHITVLTVVLDVGLCFLKNILASAVKVCASQQLKRCFRSTVGAKMLVCFFWPISRRFLVAGVDTVPSGSLNLVNVIVILRRVIKEGSVCVGCVPVQPGSAVSARIFWAVAPVVVSRPQVFLLVVR